ncbi:MAG: antitoxin Xre/MbcA/ParS toxin-binding domain-containing protein [Pseudoalteromonas distincta]
MLDQVIVRLACVVSSGDYQSDDYFGVCSNHLECRRNVCIVRNNHRVVDLAGDSIVIRLQVALLARDLFESDERAARWLTTPSDALGDVNPLTLCDSEVGARQVRRILRAIEWGHAA